MNRHLAQKICSKSGMLVEEEVLKRIARNFRLSEHARMRLNERGSDVVVSEIVLHPFLAYYNTDGTMNIAKDRYNYLVVAEKEDGTFVVITYKEKSYNNNDILYKRQLALRGYGRK